jgi:hypothetical protein
MLLTP